MRDRGRNAPKLVAAALIAAIITLTGCGTAGQTGATTPATTVTQHAAQPKKQYVKNSDTDEILNDFQYLLDYPFTDLISDAETIKRQKYEDIVTMCLTFEDEYTVEMWLYDAKRGTVFHEVSPYRPNLPCDYGEVHALSDTEKEQITAAFEKANVHEWLERDPGEEGDHTSYYYGLDAEYKGGVFEYHSGCCSNPTFPESYYDIKNLFESFDYIDNPLYAEEWDKYKN